MQVLSVCPDSSPSLRFTRGSNHQWTAVLTSPATTESLGRAIGENLQGGEIICLIGDLGAGKTVLVRGLAQGCGIPKEAVHSPTFTLIQEYHGSVDLIHADLYRIERTDDLTNLGWAELFDETRAIIIEWADRLSPAQIPTDHLTIRLAHRGRRSRSVIVTATGPVSSDVCHRVIQHFQGREENVNPG